MPFLYTQMCVHTHTQRDNRRKFIFKRNLVENKIKSMKNNKILKAFTCTEKRQVCLLI